MNRDQLWCKFWQLIYITSPYKEERNIIGGLLPQNGTWDKEDNYILTIGNSESLFCCHIDTVGGSSHHTSPKFSDGKLYVGSKNAPCLGGDDRCGILCLLAMIDENIPGTYIFHAGEERGTIGADFIKKYFDLKKFKRAIEFDRRGTTSVISNMCGSEVCSNEFATTLAEKIGIGYKPDPTGLFTDVYSYRHIIPEVTNLSVGFHQEHSNKEFVEIMWLIDKFIPSILKVNWEELPTIRTPKEDEYDWIYSSSYNFGFTRSRSENIYSSFSAEEWKNYSTSEASNFNTFGLCDLCGHGDYLSPSDHTNKFMFCEECEAKLTAQAIEGIQEEDTLLNTLEERLDSTKDIDEYYSIVAELQSSGLSYEEINRYFEIDQRNQHKARKYLNKKLRKYGNFSENRSFIFGDKLAK